MQSTLKRALPILFIVCCISCNKSEIADSTFLKMLTDDRGWIVDEVQQDHELTSAFNGMELFFSPSDYTTHGSFSNVWPKAGEYYFESPSSRILIRDDQNELFISELDQEHLVILIDFKMSEPITGRTKLVPYSFTFSRHQ